MGDQPCEQKHAPKRKEGRKALEHVNSGERVRGLKFKGKGNGLKDLRHPMPPLWILDFNCNSYPIKNRLRNKISHTDECVGT